jgi:hypothetical protein
MGNVFEKNGLDLPGGANMDALRQTNFFLGPKPQRGGRKP